MDYPEISHVVFCSNKYHTLLPFRYVDLVITSFSVLYGIYALRKSHIDSTPSLRRSPNGAFKSVPIFVCPFKEDRPALPLSTTQSFMLSIG